MRDAEKSRPRKGTKKPPTIAATEREDDPATNGPDPDDKPLGSTLGAPKNKGGRPRLPRDENGNPIGGKKGNTNGLTHGLHANKRYNLTAGKLPRDAKHVEVKMNLFRREVEAACIASKGDITLTDAAHIQTALKWERHGALALRWLNKAYDEMKPAERLNFSREIAKASTERDKAIKALNLDRDVIQDEWSTFDGKVIR